MVSVQLLCSALQCNFACCLTRMTTHRFPVPHTDFRKPLRARRSSGNHSYTTEKDNTISLETATLRNQATRSKFARKRAPQARLLFPSHLVFRNCPSFIRLLRPKSAICTQTATKRTKQLISTALRHATCAAHRSPFLHQRHAYWRWSRVRTLILFSESSNRFSGLRSLCTTPCTWQYSMPEIICWKSCLASDSSSLPRETM